MDFIYVAPHQDIYTALVYLMSNVKCYYERLHSSS